MTFGLRTCVATKKISHCSVTGYPVTLQWSAFDLDLFFNILERYLYLTVPYKLCANTFVVLSYEMRSALP